MRLSHHDFELFQEAILDLHADRDVEEFWGSIPGIFLRILPADYFVMSGFRIDPALGSVAVVEIRESAQRINREVILGMERYALRHPFTRYFLKTGDQTALKLSDFFTVAQLTKEAVVAEVYRPWGVDRVLSIGVTSRRSNAAGISVTRTGKDFTERDRLMLNLVQPHFDLACRNAERSSHRNGDDLRPVADCHLSPRESEVARWMVQGKTNPEIAIILQGSVRTIEKHVSRIIEKIGAPNRTAAALTLCRSAGT